MKNRKISEQTLLEFFDFLSKGTHNKVISDTSILPNDIFHNGTCGGSISNPTEMLRVIKLLNGSYDNE